MSTDYRSLYDRDYIGAWDLNNRDVPVTISKVIGGELTSQGGRKNKKPIVYFSGKEKGLVLNKTNGKTIAAMYGTKVEEWIGKRITLYTSMTRSPDGTGDVECIRIRPTPPQGKPQAQETEPEQGPSVADISALVETGRLDDAEALASAFAEPHRTALLAQIKAKRKETA